MSTCPDCGSDHMGPRCRMTFAQRIRSVQLSPSATPSSQRNYYDAEGVTDVFGADAKDQMMEDTRGLGYARTHRGEVYGRDHRGDVGPIDARDVDRVYLGGDTETDA